MPQKRTHNASKKRIEKAGRILQTSPHSSRTHLPNLRYVRFTLPPRLNKQVSQAGGLKEKKHPSEQPLMPLMAAWKASPKVRRMLKTMKTSVGARSHVAPAQSVQPCCPKKKTAWEKSLNNGLLDHPVDPRCMVVVEKPLVTSYSGLPGCLGSYGMSGFLKCTSSPPKSLGSISFWQQVLTDPNHWD